MNGDKRSRFKEAFERGQKGDISSYDAWLQDQGFVPERVSLEFITDNLRENPEFAPNHEDELEGIAEFIGFFTRRGGTFHIPIIGPTGMGKTQLMYTVSHMVKDLDLDIDQRFISASELVEEGETESRFYEFLDDIKQLESVIVLLDDADSDKRIDHTLQKINQKADDLFILTVWTPEHWRMEKEQVEDALPVSWEAELTNLSERRTQEALANTTDIISGNGTKISDEFYSRIYDFSLGIPGLFQGLFLESLKQSYLNDTKELSVEAVEEAAVRINLDNVRERVYDISEKKLLILKYILLSRHPKGRRPSELVDRLDRDKSTVSYHLQNLADDRILEKEKQGRSVFYRVRGSVKPVLQQKIEKEVEFYA